MRSAGDLKRPPPRPDPARPRAKRRPVRAVEEPGHLNEPSNSSSPRPSPHQTPYRLPPLPAAARDLPSAVRTGDRAARRVADLGPPCRLAPFVKLPAPSPTSVRESRPAIRHGLSNARVEQVNTQIRLITRRAFGFHSLTPQSRSRCSHSADSAHPYQPVTQPTAHAGGSQFRAAPLPPQCRVPPVRVPGQDFHLRSQRPCQAHPSSPTAPCVPRPAASDSDPVSILDENCDTTARPFSPSGSVI